MEPGWGVESVTDVPPLVLGVAVEPGRGVESIMDDPLIDCEKVKYTEGSAFAAGAFTITVPGCSNALLLIVRAQTV